MKENEKLSLVDLGKRLLEASRNGEAEVVKELMQNGAPFTTDWLGTSPLHLAAQHGHTQTAEQLLRSGVSRDARTKVDRTPLHMAAQNGHLPIVELLISYGACVNNKDMLNMTPLHWACEYNHSDIIKALLKAGAQTDIINKFGKSPMDIAGKKCGEENIALISAGQENPSIETKLPDTNKRPVERATISVNSVKKRQRTKKFPMTAGSWTGSDAMPGNSTKNRKRSAGAPPSLNIAGNTAVSAGRRLSAPAQYHNAGSPSLRSPTENSIASLVSAAELVKFKAEAQCSEAAATTAQDSSVLDTLATLATATLSHNTGPTPSSTMQHVTAISAGRGINITPLSIPASTITHASSGLTTPLTPSNMFPLQSPLAALSALTSLSTPTQSSPLANIAMSPLTFQMPMNLTPQQQLFMSGTQLVSSLSQQGSVPSASVMSSAESSNPSSSAEGTNILTSIAPSHTLMPHQFLAYAGNASQGHHFLTQIPQGYTKVEQDHTKTQESADSKPEESSSQPGQEMYVTVQVPSNIHGIPSQAIGEHSFTLQPVLVQPGAATQEQTLIGAQTSAGDKTHEQPTPATTSQVVQLQLPAGLVSQQPGQLIQIPGVAEPLTIAQLQQIMAGPVPQVIIGPQKIQLTPNSPLQVTTQTTQPSQTQTTPAILQLQPQQQQISQQLLQQSIPQGLLQQNIVTHGVELQQPGLPPSIPSQVFLQVQEDFRKLIEQQKVEEERQRKELEEKLLTLEQHSKKYRSELEIAQKAAETYRDQLQAESRERVRLLELYESPKKTTENPTTTTVGSTPK